MKLLLDHCVPRPLRSHFPGHEVHTAYERGWGAHKNGALLSAAEAEGFAALVTTDQNLPYQQNVTGRRIALLILVAPSNRVPDLVPLAPRALEALETIGHGQVVRVELPPPPPDVDATTTPPTS